jgi:hypothetical protein
LPARCIKIKEKTGGKKMIKEIHIFDFDGTLVDSSHRYKTLVCEDGVERIDLEYWIANEHKAAEDQPIEHSCQVFREVADNPEKYALIATARIWCGGADSVCEKANIKPNAIVSRAGREDTRGGAAIKVSYVKRLLNLKQFKGVERIHIHEDNISYLKAIQKEFNAISHFYPSKQGH